MERKGFRNFLQEIGFSQKSISEFVDLGRELEDKFGEKLEDTISRNNEVQLKNYLSLVAKEERKGRKDKTHVFLLYYRFFRGVWFDDWRPRVSSKTVNYLVEKTYVPSSLSGYSDENHAQFRYVFYEKGVPEEEKIPGLRTFLEENFIKVMSSLTNFFREAFGENIDEPFIPILLSNQYPIDKYEENDEYIAKKIWELTQKKTSGITQQEISEIMEFKRHASRRLGEYHPDGFSVELAKMSKEEEMDASENFSPVRLGRGCFARPYIVIYYRNYSAESETNYLNQVLMTFAHETSHFCHHQAAPDTFCGKGKYGKEVKEAVADYCSVLYMEDLIRPPYQSSNSPKPESVARFQSWVNNFGSSWPYANALYLCKTSYSDKTWTDITDLINFFDNKHRNRLESVIRKSAESMARAYSCMKTFSSYYYRFYW